jgi:1-acylglycerone phosphate reductase
MSTSPNPSPIYILITGISPGGLGDALTNELLKQPNTHILATGLSLTHLSHLPPSPRVSKIELDVTSPTSISTALATTRTITHGRLHYLINNAGYGYMMPLLDASPQAVKQNFDVNVFGLLAVTQAFFPLLREGKGTVVNQCSIASLAGGRQPFIGSYCASKAAVASLNDTMRVEFEPFGVGVSSCYTMLAALVYLMSNANVTTCRSSV